jgi:hypothetical protein
MLLQIERGVSTSLDTNGDCFDLVKGHHALGPETETADVATASSAFAEVRLPKTFRKFRYLRP